MKRITAVLILMAAGLLISSIPFLPNQAVAGDLPGAYLVIPDTDTRDDLLGDLAGGPPPGGGDDEGDPDGMGDGLGFDDQGDVIDTLSMGDIPGDLTLEELLIYLMSSVWLVP